MAVFPNQSLWVHCVQTVLIISRLVLAYTMPLCILSSFVQTSSPHPHLLPLRSLGNAADHMWRCFEEFFLFPSYQPLPTSLVYRAQTHTTLSWCHSPIRNSWYQKHTLWHKKFAIWQPCSALFMKAKIDTLRYFLLSNAVYFFLEELSLRILENFGTNLAKIDIFTSNRDGIHSTY